MKIAIIYATHHGTTETVAQQIQLQLPTQEVELVNLAQNKKPDIDVYDMLILGSSIHAGKNQALMQNFCRRNMSELLQKPVGLFLCCMNKNEFEKNKENAYPDILRKHAFDFQVMGGEYKIDKMNFIERFLLKRIAGVTQSQTMINYENMHDFTTKIMQLIV